ncbi:MAG: dihydrofolate reductase [Betaproteobacteria bacterium]|nr:dihydrofolate reductase [Betaproteobacteria bacterium]
MTRCVSLIVAMSQSGVIGDRGRIPWHLPAELARFKRVTMGHHIVMGRRTWESIGRLLPGRRSVVVSRNPDFAVPGAIVTDSLRAALAICLYDEEVFVIGGAEIFREALPLADRLYLTVVDVDVPGDTRMPAIDFGQWQVTDTEQVAADGRNPYPFRFTRYERKHVATE